MEDIYFHFINDRLLSLWLRNERKLRNYRSILVLDESGGGINADNNNSRDYGESRMEGGKFQTLLLPLLPDQRWKTMTRNTNKIGKEESEHVSYNKKIKFIIRIKEEKLRAPATIGVVVGLQLGLVGLSLVSAVLLRLLVLLLFLMLHHPSPTLYSSPASTCLSPYRTAFLLLLLLDLPFGGTQYLSSLQCGVSPKFQTALETATSIS